MASVVVGGTRARPVMYIVFHWRSMRGVGDSRRRGIRKKERERVFPASRAETVMPSVWAMRIGSGLSVAIF